MSVHDWTRVEAGIFHAFHTAWMPAIQQSLNSSVLPEGYYALAEQHAGSMIADVLTLHASADGLELVPRGNGGTAVAEAPPKVSRRQTIEGSAVARRRTLAIRHVSGHRLIAILEILSPANKDRASHLDNFAAKIVEALDAGVHVLVVDLFPPGPHDPQSVHALIRRRLDLSDEPYDVPPAKPLTLASYAAGQNIEVYLEHISVGDALPAMPLFLRSERYVDVPLEATYLEAYSGMPAFWRNVVEGRPPGP